jgi:hypothetical protein
MAALLTQLARLFVEPSPGRPERAVQWLAPSTSETTALVAHGPAPAPRGAPTTPPRHAATLAVVCSPRDVRLAGGAAALAAAYLARANCALVAEWTGLEPSLAADRASAPAARRTAVALRADGHIAQAAGRLVRIALPPAGDDAVAVVREAVAPTGYPTVLVVAGPRGEALGALLAEQDVTLLVQRPGGDPELEALTVAGLVADGAHVRTVALASSPGAAVLARSGTRLVAPLRGPFLTTIGGHR